jgi:hypothetical protein
MGDIWDCRGLVKWGRLFEMIEIVRMIGSARRIGRKVGLLGDVQEMKVCGIEVLMDIELEIILGQREAVEEGDGREEKIETLPISTILVGKSLRFEKPADM